MMVDSNNRRNPADLIFVLCGYWLVTVITHSVIGGEVIGLGKFIFNSVGVGLGWYIYPWVTTWIGNRGFDL